MNSTNFAIETQHLSKSFGDKSAVRDLSLSVERGEVFGFLGPNGAGKTTSVKMLLDLVRPSSGSASLLGKALGDPESRARIGFLPEHFRFHDWLSAVEFLHLHADLYRMPADQKIQRSNELLELVGLLPHSQKKLQEFSKGMLQRIGLAQALLNRPQLVILDEPTSGLDPVGRRLVRDIIRDLREKGTTVFLNSHLLSEVEITCDRVAFIKHGEVIRTSSLQDLLEGELSVEIRVRNFSDSGFEGLKQWSKSQRRDGEHITLTLDNEDNLPEINRYLVQQGAEVYALRPQHVSLEELFIEIVGTDGGL